MERKLSQEGFTLIELLIVIGILAVLATVVVLVLNPTALSAQARDATRRSDMKSIQTALSLYVVANGSFPSTAGAWWGACSSYGSHDRSGANGYVPNLAPQYMTVLPTDPKLGDAGDYKCYLYRSDGVDYKLLAHQTVESESPPMSTSDPFYDPPRGPSQPTWALYTQGASGW